MSTPTVFRSALALVFTFLTWFIAGCTSGPGGGFSLFPQGHKLTETAKNLRNANAPPLEVARELEKQPLPPYTVEPGDILLVVPADLDSPVRLPADEPVLPDGTINLGKFGQLQVMGRTVREIEDLVSAAVKPHVKEAGFISVRLVSRQSKVYYVIGAVNSPGRFQLTGNETALDAILQAGGLTDNASRDNIILTRPSKPNCPRVVLPVCWKQIVQHGNTATNYQIAPGDRIYVPTRGTLESMPLFNKHSKSPCGCDDNAPQALPPYRGDDCLTPEPFRGIVEPRDLLPLPKKQ